MKIGILTYYGVHNYGAILQAYGLQRVLSTLGHDVEFLKFQRNYDYMPEGADKKYEIGLKSIPLLTKYFIDNGAGTFIYNYEKKKELDSFRDNRLNIGKRYSDVSVDAVVIGSDEVFSVDVGINPFFYGHNLNCGIVISYAATFGSTTYESIIDKNCETLISSGINKMSSISVRDEASVNIVDKLIGKKPTLVCDPVILYGFKKEIQRLKAKPMYATKYILLYSYDRNCNSQSEINEIRTFAAKHGCKVFSVGYFHKWCDKNISCSPIELLWYFLNAQYVLTDTFHGSVLSIITNKDFSVVLRNTNQKVEFLLSQYDLSSRLTSNFEGVDTHFKNRIDYHKVNSIIKVERARSIKYLEESLFYHD